ncbi:phage tail tape measure protein, TP901 family, core region [Terribacillus aidingensis]|uniref:Phage tail tape measure protein, TP901 family, core region n=1 Tax=Terribacillus aidingensis TaxID=586416 RepID=A0A285NLX4_9BACI|nr:phage tail tape measure protein [Terribacillus aidingensis]SNZ09923.1 phage tail tape measure protein, TP901 family, core region [Terribacillus aidingensis]
MLSEDLKIILSPSADTSRQATNQLNQDIKLLQGKAKALNIKSEIDISKSSISEINKQIASFQKQLKPIKLDVIMDKQVEKVLNGFTKSIDGHVKSAKDLNKVIEEQITVTKKLDGTTEKTSMQHKQNGEILQKSTRFVNEQTQALQKQAQAAKVAQDQITKYGQTLSKTEKRDATGNYLGGQQKNRLNYEDITYNTDREGNISSIRTTDNIDKRRKAVQQLETQLKSLKQQGEVSATTLSKLSNAINIADTLQDIEIVRQLISQLDDDSKARQRTRELEKQLELYKRQAAVNVQNLERRFSSAIGPDGQAGLNNYLNSVNSLSAKTPNVSQQMKSLNMEFKEISSNVNTAASHVNTFGQELQTALARTVTWGVAMTSIYGSLNAFRNITEQIVEVDTLMTNIRRVMDIPDSQFNTLLSESIDLSIQLGNTLPDVLTMMGEFGRLGYEGDQLADLAESAQILQNIGELSPEDSVKSITAAMTNFNIAAKDSESIIDRINEVDNQFSVSSLDLSQSIRRAGSTASVFGADLDELLGYTTAIGASTRESGNIIGKLVADVKSSLIDLEPLTLRRGRQGASVMAA